MKITLREMLELISEYTNVEVNIDKMTIPYSTEVIYVGMCYEALEELSEKQLNLLVIFIDGDWDGSRIQIYLYPPK